MESKDLYNVHTTESAGVVYSDRLINKLNILRSDYQVSSAESK